MPNRKVHTISFQMAYHVAVCTVGLLNLTKIGVGYSTTHIVVYALIYCLNACLYTKCCNLVGWIIEHGPSIHFRTDGPYHLYGFRSKLKHRIFGKMAEKLSTEVVKVSHVQKIVGKFSETFRKNLKQ